jgi:hypothetical protein
MQNFFDLKHIKNNLKWKPTLSHVEMLNLPFFTYKNSLNFEKSAGVLLNFKGAQS